MKHFLISECYKMVKIVLYFDILIQSFNNSIQRIKYFLYTCILKLSLLRLNLFCQVFSNSKLNTLLWCLTFRLKNYTTTSSRHTACVRSVLLHTSYIEPPFTLCCFKSMPVPPTENIQKDLDDDFDQTIVWIARSLVNVNLQM